MTFLKAAPGDQVPLPTAGPFPDAVHVFDDRTIDAINAALAARRPLLVRGEPGVGKSQVARAAAVALGRTYVEQILDARSQARDLLWHFDAVERLAMAQIANVLGDDRAAVKAALDVAHFVRPGPLWWAFDWASAEQQARYVGQAPPPQSPGAQQVAGTVVLVDEIDKAEADVPNGLLEALGTGQFTPQGLATVTAKHQVPPLVIITTNEERLMPDAFLRRCLVLHLQVPEDPEALKQWLHIRGRAHFPHLIDDTLEQAAEQLAADRAQCLSEGRYPLPGQAEFLDLLRAVNELAPGSAAEQVRLLASLSEFVLIKSVAQ